jgi:hypothetical protein
MDRQMPPLEALRATIIYSPIPWPQGGAVVSDDDSAFPNKLLTPGGHKDIAKLLGDKRWIGLPRSAEWGLRHALEVQKVLPQIQALLVTLVFGGVSERALGQEYPGVFEVFRRSLRGPSLLGMIRDICWRGSEALDASSSFDKIALETMRELQELVRYLDGLPKPLDNPRFWEKVRQLAFAFKEDNLTEILGFYSECGPFGGPWGLRGQTTTVTAEPLAYIAGWLEWFRRVTTLVDALKKGRPIPETGGLAGGYYVQESVWPTGHASDDDAEWFTASVDSMHKNAQVLAARYSWKPEWMTRGLVVHGFSDYTLDFKIEFEGGATEASSEDVRVKSYVGAWKEITRTVTRQLNSIELTPITQDFSRSDQPTVLWGFKPNGALQAAFLQWYFQEFAYVKMPICAADGCTGLVPPNRRSYCSPQCQWKMKQRRHRERVKRGPRVAASS